MRCGRIIKEEDPPKPSTRLFSTRDAATIAGARQTEPAKLAKLVRGELDWIVMKALEKDRGRRYQTANGFAHDIQRYLADEPVEACPPSTGYRLHKFARKNRRVLVTAGAFVLLLAAAALASTWQAIRATLAETKARQARAGNQACGRRPAKRGEGQPQREASRAIPEGNGGRALAVAESQKSKAQAAEQLARTAEEAGRKLLYMTDMQLAPFLLRDGRTTADQLRATTGETHSRSNAEG